MIPKRPASYFFGATNQAVGPKGVKIGDLLTAQNVKQVKGGEFSKRDGFTVQGQAYGGGTIVPDAIISPDGVQVITRDAVQDHVFARSTTTQTNQDQGHADRFVPYVRTRIPALGTGQQQLPMAKQTGKQAGSFMAWLLDEGDFCIAQVNPDVAATLGSPTEDAVTFIQQSGPISVNTISGGLSTKVKSFALYSGSLDSYNLWFVWVDWTNCVYAYAIPYANLQTGTFSTVAVVGAFESYWYDVEGVIINTTDITSVAMGEVDYPGGLRRLAVTYCGIIWDHTAHFSSPGQAGDPAQGFRVTNNTAPSNYAQSFGGHCYLDVTTGMAIVGSQIEYVTKAFFGQMTACACTLASVAGGFQTNSAYWWYSFLANGNGGDWAIILVKVPAATPQSPVLATRPFSAPLLDAYELPLDWSAQNFTAYGWFYSGQMAAKETSTGVDVAVTLIPYYADNGAYTATYQFRTFNPDYQATECWSWNGSTWSRKWRKLGACIAGGWMRLRDYSATGAGAKMSGKDYLLTVWEDNEALQTCYHVREWDTGEILAQLAYGEAAHVGHGATRDMAVQKYCSDVQQPMLAGINGYGGLPLNLVVGLQSQNQNSCVDVAVILLQTWDFVAGARPKWTKPRTFRNLALLPGPIPTVVNGFQRLREAGPLVYPYLRGYVGSNDPLPYTEEIKDGDTTTAVVYRLTDSNGDIWRSSPYILANSQYWTFLPGGPPYHVADSFVRIATLRHLMAGTVAEIELYFGQVDLQLFGVYPNDSTVNWLDVYPKHNNGGTWNANPPALAAFSLLEDAVTFAGVGEDLYTTGGALEAMPPPIARCLHIWRNRAFVANENNIYPSQEFADGFGIRWNEVTRVEWSDGGGDILAMAEIDWNYLALFKRDAIGVISGPGPDGMGSGNYVVQTLATKSGCTNVASIVTGADGLYYQDAQTGRIMLLTAGLGAPQEAAPGVFDLSSEPIVAALHVERLRQIWWVTGNTGTIIVLDYAHRTDSAPCGEVYTWSLGTVGNIADLAIAGSAPLAIMATDGSVARQVAGQYFDIGVNGATLNNITMTLCTADMNPIGPQRQFGLSRLQVLGEYLSPHGLIITVWPDYTLLGSEQRSTTCVVAPEQRMVRPSNCQRIQAVRVQVAETLIFDGTTHLPIIGPALKFVGFGLEVQDYGKLATLSMGSNI